MVNSRKTRWLAAAMTIAAGLGVIAAPVAAAAAPAQLTLPSPTGPDRIGTVELHLVDPTRADPYVPTDPVRELMVQVWYPASDTARYPAAPWLDTGAVPNFEQVNGIPPGVLSIPVTDGHVGAPVDRSHGARPVVLYSTGLGGDRAEGTTLVEDLVSHGYIVVAIDHTHDASEVEFPGGRIEVSALPPVDSDAVAAQAEQIRVADTRFVLDELAILDRGGNPDAEHRRLPGSIAGALDLSHTGMFGFSIGGATAAGAMYADPRIRSGIDMDGTLYGPVVTGGLDRPFLLMSSQNHNRDNDTSWAQFWAAQRGPKLDLKLTNSQHQSYSDLESLLPQAAPLIGLPPGDVVLDIGTVDPVRALAAQRAYILAFFDRTLRHVDGHLLDGPSRRFPEIQFIP